jgi:hypothetical protein
MDAGRHSHSEDVKPLRPREGPEGSVSVCARNCGLELNRLSRSLPGMQEGAQFIEALARSVRRPSRTQCTASRANNQSYGARSGGAVGRDTPNSEQWLLRLLAQTLMEPSARRGVSPQGRTAHDQLRLILKH